MKLPVTGIIPPIVTPLISNTELDVQGLKNLIAHLLSGGVHGIFALGTTGEATNLSYSLRKEFIHRTCEFVGKKVPVFIGITDTCLQGSLEMANAAKDAGADAVVISAPYYLPMSQNEFVFYLEQLVPQLPLPFLMYNMPSCTKLQMSLSTVRRAMEMGAIGIKDSSGNLPYLLSLIEEFKDSPEFAIIAGSEMFIPETIKMGGHGAVPGGANIFPSLFVDLYNASVNGDIEKIEFFKGKMQEIEDKIYNVGSYSSKHIKTIKSALSALGICSDYVAMPFHKFDEVKTNRIKQNLKEMNILEAVHSNTIKT